MSRLLRDNAPVPRKDSIPLLNALAQLYPDHEAYVSKYSAAVDRLLAAGFILAPDAEAAKSAARAAPVGL